MSDHYHDGEYAEARRDHRGEYADERHDHAPASDGERPAGAR
jgi:hypothetical protein